MQPYWVRGGLSLKSEQTWPLNHRLLSQPSWRTDRQQGSWPNEHTAAEIKSWAQYSCHWSW